MKLQVTIDQSTTAASPGESLFECAERAGVRIPTSCNRNGKCKECLVEVIRGMEVLSPPSPEEEHLAGAFRLSCRARLLETQGEVACQTLRRGALRIEERGVELLWSLGAATLDPGVTRREGGIFLEDHRLGPDQGPLHGLAVDLGTTTCVVRLVDLESGKTLASVSFENPQRFAGSDVMARIQYDGEHRGKLLQRAVLAYLGHALKELPVDPRTIYEVVIAANTTMRDLFFGLDVQSIGQRPYHSITQHQFARGERRTTALEVRAKSLRLPIHEEARVVGLPILHGHVGADAAACILAAHVADEKRLVAIMDLGTNTELILGNRERILVASCPAGPAFEGGKIARGMPALEGAIEHVSIDASGRPTCQVIGGGTAKGICGSGLVETLGELLRTGRMDSHGRLTNGDERFLLDPDGGVYLGEADISELAQAKGANVAGLQILLSRYGVAFEDIDVFYLAGGFGRHLDIAAARRIGLVPDLPDERILQVGNAAIEGATLALCSLSARRRLEEIARAVEHAELETDPQFFDYFVAGCQFQPVDGRSLARLE